MNQIYVFIMVEDPGNGVVIFAKNEKEAEEKLCNHLIQEEGIREYLEKWNVPINSYAEDFYMLVDVEIVK